MDSDSDVDSGNNLGLCTTCDFPALRETYKCCCCGNMVCIYCQSDHRDSHSYCIHNLDDLESILNKFANLIESKIQSYEEDSDDSVHDAEYREKVSELKKAFEIVKKIYSRFYTYTIMMLSFDRSVIKDRITTFKSFDKSPGKKLLWSLSQLSYLQVYPRIPYVRIEFIRKLGNIPNLKEMLKNFDFNSVRFSIVNSYYDYTNYQGNWYVDFANEHLGGGVFSDGFVQEEKMCFVFPELMIMCDLARRGNYDRIDPYTPNTPVYENRTGAILITNLLKALVSEGTNEMDNFYGNIDNPKYFINGNLSGACVKPVVTHSYVNIIALDAKRLESKHNSVSVFTLMTYITKAFNGFSAARSYDRDYGTVHTVIHSGAWGTGAFNNELYTMLAVQVIAASLANVELVFYLKDTKDNIVNITNFIYRKVRNIIDQIISV